VVLNPAEQKIVDALAIQLLKETGKYSRSEAARQLISAGAKAIGVKVAGGK